MTTLGGLDWCGVAVGLGCCCWQCYRCLKFGANDSKGWLEAGPGELKDLMYYAQLNLAAYAESVAAMDERTSLVVSENVLNFVGDDENRRAPPYFLYINHEKKDIALVFRGLNMASKKDFAVLMRKKHKAYNHGFVHSGMLKAAQWALRQEERILKKHCTKHPEYTLTIVGHSLGAGVASLLCVLLHDKPTKVGIDPRDKDRIRAVCFAPPRVISRNHVANYSHAICGVVLQDDFFSRVSTSVVQHIFLGFTGVWLAGILTQACLSDFFVPSGRRLRDPARLYPPGKLYHIVYKEPWHCGKVGPRVLTSTPTGGRFEKLILSLTATSDHHIRSYNKFLYQALQGLGFEGPAAETQLAAPVAQRLARAHSIDREGMRVEDEGKARDLRGKLRPRKSYEITLEGTSSNVERYAEETASIGSEEGEEERRGERNGTVERNGNDGLDVTKSREGWNGMNGLEREGADERDGEIEGKDYGDERNGRSERNRMVQSAERKQASVLGTTDRRLSRKGAERDMKAIWEDISYPVEIAEVPEANCGRVMPSKPLRRKVSGLRDETRLAPAASTERWEEETAQDGGRTLGETFPVKRAPKCQGARKEAVQLGAVGKAESGATLESLEESQAGTVKSSGCETERKGAQSAGSGFWKRWFGLTGGTRDGSNLEQSEDSEGENGGRRIHGAASLGGEPQWEAVSRRHGGIMDSKDSHWETICLQL